MCIQCIARTLGVAAAWATIELAAADSLNDEPVKQKYTTILSGLATMVHAAKTDEPAFAKMMEDIANQGSIGARPVPAHDDIFWQDVISCLGSP